MMILDKGQNNSFVQEYKRRRLECPIVGLRMGNQIKCKPVLLKFF